MQHGIFCPAALDLGSEHDVDILHLLYRVGSEVIGEVSLLQTLLQMDLSMFRGPEDLWLLSG